MSAASITGKTRLLGVMGWPVGHSSSPLMHNAALRAAGLDIVYVPFSVPPAELEDAVRGLRALGVLGFNVTLPHKSTIMPLLDELEADARSIGAVNTVVRDGEALCGLNTDASGLVHSLAEAGVTLQGVRAVVLGAGGAARAAVVGLSRAGVESIAIAARRPDRAHELVRDLAPAIHTTRLEASGLPDGLDRAVAGSTLLVQATSATLEGNRNADAFARALPLDRLATGAVVVDLVYRPLETSVLRAARALGLRTLDGTGMLVHQGALAYERWTGVAPDLGVMRAALPRT